MTDYIIVGCGLAGIAFAETALAAGKSVIVFDDHSHQSSVVAAGVYNPVILKRFSALQHAKEQLDLLDTFYKRLESRLGVCVNHPMPILRRFFSVEEQNNWFAASDKAGLSAFLSTDLVKTKYPNVRSPFDFGQVRRTGYVDTTLLILQYKRYLESIEAYRAESFDYAALVCDPTSVRYHSLSARHIVFAEGFGIRQNPYFGELPLNGTKGEVLVIRAPMLRIDAILKGNVFVLPLGSDRFKIGATYNWDDKTTLTTREARAELQQKLSELLDCEYEIVDQQAGIRPTVKDRKALLGTHKEWNRLHVLNGLGTRGVMLGPYCAQILFDHIERAAPIPPALDIARFG